MIDISLCAGNGHVLCETCKRCVDRYDPHKVVAQWTRHIEPHAGPDGCVYHYPAPRVESRNERP